MNNAASSDKATGVRSFLRYVLHLLKDQRGEVNPQEGESEWDVTGGETMPDQVPEGEGAPETPPEPEPEGEPPPSAETLKPEEGEAPKEEDEGEQPPFHTHPRWQEMVQKNKDLEASLAAKEEEIANRIGALSKQMEFYQTQLNAVYKGQPKPGQQPGVNQQSPQQPQAATPTPTPQLEMAPEPTPIGVEIPGIPPEANVNRWEHQGHQAQYIDARIGQHLNHKMSEVPRMINEVKNDLMTNTVTPAIALLAKRISQIQEHLTKSSHEDYNDVIGSVMDKIFHRADGKILGIQDQALLSYFQNEDNPYLSMYNWGATMRGPETIKKGVQKATKQAVQKLVTRPKAATQVSGKPSDKVKAELDWDTPVGEAEKIMADEGLIPG